MKKLRSSQILVLVLLLGALLLTGCGKKNSPPVDPVDPNAPKIHFVMPGTYVDEEDQERDIPAGRTVKFYTVEYFDDEEESATYDADKHVFTGTTKAGGGKITCALPDSMLGKERYIFAIVVLEGDYDLNGKTMNEMYEAVVTKKILYSDISEDGYKLFTLTDGITIEGFDFVGVFGDPPI